MYERSGNDTTDKVAKSESITAAELLTLTQYVVVVVNTGVVKVAAFVPTGLVVSPTAP
jgi:hypothetical protein